MDETTALAVPGKVEHVFLSARNSQEMAESKVRLKAWLTKKLASCTAEHDEIDAAVKQAEKHKWAVSSLRSARSRARGRMIYYDKLLQATKAGYVMIPWMGFDAFAVRVVREEAKLLSSGTSKWGPQQIPEQPSDFAPAGEGRYVSNASEGIQREGPGSEKDSVIYFSESTGFKEVDFPVLAAKPNLMSATANAMALKIFDEIGVAPNRRGRDPLIVGAVKGPKGRIHFLIAWYLDTRAL